MAGSMTWGEYVSDTGLKYAIRIDKSNAKSITGLTRNILVSPRGADYPELPVGLTPRYLSAYNRYAPAQKRKFVVGTAALITPGLYSGSEYIYTLPTSSATGAEAGGAILWLVTGYYGETYKRMPVYYGQLDTGLTDGTPY